MSSWRKEPPTYEEWLAAHNHGCWWVKFKLTSEFSEEVDGELCTWPEFWLTEIVTIASSYPNGISFRDRGKNARLHATGTMGLKFDLDDEEKTKHMYWQSVAPPLDDIKDKEPEV